MNAPESEDGFPEIFDGTRRSSCGMPSAGWDSREAAQDVVSDTFTAAWRHWDRRPGPAELLPWLYAIAGNSVRGQRRSAERRRRLTGRLSALRPPHPPSASTPGRPEMSARASYRGAITEIQSLVGDGGTGPADLDDATRAWLLATRQAITAQRRAPGRGRGWWPARPRRQHRRRVVVSCVAVPALLAATAAGWVIVTSPPASRVAENVLCYSYVPSVYSHVPDHVPSGARAQVYATALTMATGEPPTVTCARLWANGAIIGDPRSHYVPPLVACVIPPTTMLGLGKQEGVGVFPDTTCAALHLAELPPGYNRAAWRLFILHKYLDAGLIGTAGRPRCLGVRAADAYVRRALRRFGFTGWRVTNPWGVTPWSVTGAACWGGQADSTAHTIQVLPIP